MLGQHFSRVYETLVAEHFRDNRQMFFLMGPRQVGKTTTARDSAGAGGQVTYLNWDNSDHRRVILGGPEAIRHALGLDRLGDVIPVCVLDELHKYRRWKVLLKGLFDSYGSEMRFLVTGSARLDLFRAGGDSLMGRYFPYRMHPLSVAELIDVRLVDTPVRPPARLDSGVWEALRRFGGYPEPLLKQSDRFWKRWTRTRGEQLFKEDLRDLTGIRELGQVELLARLIQEQVGRLTSYSSLAGAVGASVDSIRRWLGTLERLYYCYALRPWYRNVSRSLRKEPRYYLWDWSQAPDAGRQAENLVAGALLKAVNLWTDGGLGDFGLYFLRDKQKHEVDFVVVRDGSPWFLVEVKLSGKARLSPELRRFQEMTGARHAFQVALDMDYVDRDCFEVEKPVIVPALTLLSQLA